MSSFSPEAANYKEKNAGPGGGAGHFPFLSFSVLIYRMSIWRIPAQHTCHIEERKRQV